MKFRSNNSVAVHLPDLRRAEAFYSGVMGFRLVAKSATQLAYDTGRFLLYVNRSTTLRAPIPSFTVIDTSAARAHLLDHGCKIIEDRGRALYFTDPFGLVFDVVED